MSTDFYDGEVSEVIRPKDLSAAGVATLSTSSPKAAGTASNPTVPTEPPSKGLPPTGYGRRAPGLVSGVHFSAGRIVFQTSGNAGNAGIAPHKPCWRDRLELAHLDGPGPRRADCQRPYVPRPQRRRHGVRRGSGRLAGRRLPAGAAKTRSPAPTASRRTTPTNTKASDSRPRETTASRRSSSTTTLSARAFEFVNKEMDMSMSIASPTVFYGVYNSGGWKGSNSEVEDYWGGASGTKTNNDPCPAGYPRTDVRRNQRVYQGHRHEQDRAGKRQRPVVRTQKYTVGDQTFMFPGSALRVWSAKMRYPGRVTFFRSFNYFADNGKESPRLL